MFIHPCWSPHSCPGVLCNTKFNLFGNDLAIQYPVITQFCTMIETQVTKSGEGITSSVQFSSAAQSCLALCDPMDCRTPGVPVQQHLQGLPQSHVHLVSNAIQPSYPLMSPSSLPSVESIIDRHLRHTTCTHPMCPLCSVGQV